MRETLPATVVEGAATVFEALVALALTAAGVVAEIQGAQVVGTDLPMALWLAYVGLIALYSGVVVVGRGRLLPRLRARAGS